MYFDPFRAFHAQITLSAMAMEAGAVVWMRMLGMSGLWPVPRTENARMVHEKQSAFAEASQQAMRAAWAGQGPQGMIDAAIAPLDRTARANRKRLSRRGLRLVKGGRR